MIIFNTTYHASSDKESDFIDWAKEFYIPQAIHNGILSYPRLTLIMSEEKEEGKSFSLQFEVEDLDALSAWYSTIGESLRIELTKKFGNQVVGFITLLQNIEL